MGSSVRINIFFSKLKFFLCHPPPTMGSTRKLSGWFALLVLLIFQVLCSHAADTIAQGEIMRDGATLVSSSNVFQLGFFTPQGGTKNCYLGIWYKQVSVRTVVWVANREMPLMTNTSAVLTINDDGNLMILDGIGEPIMLTSVSPPSTNSTSATLLDNGNFVLRNEAGRVVWQSFDYPTDTILAGMKIGMDLKTGRNWSLISWKSAEDPAPGPYSFGLDPDGTFRFLIKHKGEIHWSSGAWNGVILSLVPEMKRVDINNYSFVANENEKLITYSLLHTRTRSRVVLDSSGQIQLLQWLEDGQYWSLLWDQPKDECDVYDACGANARCNISSPSLRCSCLEGFFSSDGPSKRSSGRCVRQTNLMCGDEDGFYRVADVKLPDQSQYDRHSSPGIGYCESRCRSNCSCTAYATAYDNGTGGCLFWSGELMGLRDSPHYINGDDFGTGDLFIRLAGPDLSATINNSRKKKKKQIWVIVVVVVSVEALFKSLFLCYLLRRRKLKHKGRMETSDEQVIQLCLTQ